MTITVNGVSLYYEQSGEGPPMLLLHGNSENHHIFDGVAEKLACHFTLYAIDSRDHGESDKVETLSYADMAEDTAAFIKELDIEKPVLLGFSDGGIVGLMVAYQYPGLLSKLIVCGANMRPDQVKGWFNAFIKVVHTVTRDKKMAMMLGEPNITAEDLGKITIPTMVLAGSRDIVEESGTREIARSIPDAKMFILPGEGHVSYIQHSQRLYRVIRPFLRRGYRQEAAEAEVQPQEQKQPRKTKSAPKTKAKAKPKTKTGPKVKAAPQAQAKAEPKTKTTVRAKAAAQPPATAKPKAEPAPKAKTKAPSAAEPTKAKPAPKRKTTSDANPVNGNETQPKADG